MHKPTGFLAMPGLFSTERALLRQTMCGRKNQHKSTVCKKKKKSKYYVYAFKLTQSDGLMKDRDSQETFCAK